MPRASMNARPSSIQAGRPFPSCQRHLQPRAAASFCPWKATAGMSHSWAWPATIRQPMKPRFLHLPVRYPIRSSTRPSCAQPLSDIWGARNLDNRLRDYAKLPRHLEGLLVCGDSVYALNPIYAQGMTVGALSALAIDQCMREQRRAHPNGDLRGLAQRVQARIGKKVAIATARSYKSVIESHSLEHIRAGLEWDESNLEGTLPEIRAVPRGERTAWLFEHVFMDRSPRQMIPDLLAAANLWSPDVFVVSNYELSGLIAAELLDLPYATCNISFRWPRELIKLMCRPTLAQLREEFNLPPDPDCPAYGHHLDLCLMPDGWTLGRAMAQPAYAQVVARKLLGPQRNMALRAALLMFVLGLGDARQQRIRQRRPNPRELYVRPGGGASSGRPPAWLADMPNQPTVYVSLGTVFNALYPEVFESILAGLRNEPINLILTLGANGDPARFGPQPPNVHIERYIPQSEIVPYVDVCLNHGGYNTVIEPLLYGIPQVVLPLAADQPLCCRWRRISRWAGITRAQSGEADTADNAPKRFDPDRFTSEQVAQRHKLAWVPFGAGQRQCIGKDFSIMEAQIILAMIIQRYTLTAAPGPTVLPKLTSTFVEPLEFD